jgi:hypothetical protein
VTSAVDRAGADDHRVAAASRASSRGVFRITLTTPDIALAPQTADAGPRYDFDPLDLVQVGRHEVPHHHAEEVEVDAAAVNQRELRRRERGGGAPRS